MNRALLRGFRASFFVAGVLAIACRSEGGAATASESGGSTDGGGSEATTTSTGGESTSSNATVVDDSGATSSESSTTGDTGNDCPEPPAEPPCDALGDGRCFYIDPTNGDDLADGSSTAPWRTFVNIDSSIYYSTYPPAPEWVELQPGDVVYVGDGTVEQIFHPGDDGGPDGGGSYLLYLRAVAGTADAPITITRLPGARPILQPEAQAIAILVQDSSNLVIDGFEIRGAYGRGIRIGDAQDVAVAHVLVYDTDGTAADNVAGLEILDSTDVEVSDSVFADNYDRSAAQAGTQTENSGNLVMFSNAGTIAIRHCAFYQSGGPDSQFSGFGVKYKHASPDQAATFELADSYVEGTWFGIGIGTAHAFVHHNVIIDSGTGISTEDFGGPTHQWDQRFVANTIVADSGFYVSPSLDWLDEGGPWPDVTENVFERNLVVDTSDEQVQDRRTVLFNPYMTDEQHDALAEGIALDDNCYHREAGPASFGFAESTNYGQAGGAFDLAGWRATYGFDAASVEADPMLADLGPAVDGPCVEMGAFTEDHAPAIDFADPLACGDAITVRRWE